MACKDTKELFNIISIINKALKKNGYKIEQPSPDTILIHKDGKNIILNITEEKDVR